MLVAVATIFGKTGDIENRVRRHRFARRLDRARSISLAPNHAAISRDQHDSARQMLLLDLASRLRRRSLQAFARRRRRWQA